MRNNDDEKKEKIIMIASSVLVLTALTMTGVYMKMDSRTPEDDGYTLDFTALEDTAGNKSREIAEGYTRQEGILVPEDFDAYLAKKSEEEDSSLEVDSGKVQIGAEKKSDKTPLVLPEFNKPSYTEEIVEETVKLPMSPIVQEMEPDVAVQSSPEAVQIVEEAPQLEETPQFHFAAENMLHRPVEGEVLIPFSMDSSVYFTTLDQYKYNPALMLVATEGLAVNACADGVVTAVFDDYEIGHAITVDLGDGYLLTYGQLQDVQVSAGSVVHAGDVIGAVAAPTRIYSVEGANLYLMLTKDGIPVDPEQLFP